MMPRPPRVPALYVEGTDDVSVIAALLRGRGIDTKQGTEHLWISPFGDIQTLLDGIPDVVRAERELPVGFVLDIDIDVTHRWQAVRDRLRSIGYNAPASCPEGGYLGQLGGYPSRFGIWLMPDCKTDGQILEHLIPSLMRVGDPLWPHAQKSTNEAAKAVDAANTTLTSNLKWRRFGEQVRIKAEVHSWLAWQAEPGSRLGAAINNKILGVSSPQADAFIRWLGSLYGFTALG